MKKQLSAIIFFCFHFLFCSGFLLAQSGIVDSTFGVNGISLTPLSATGQAVCRNLISLPNGKIIATGYSYTGSRTEFTIVRYKNDGTPDSSFAVNGVNTTSINNSISSISYCSVLQPNGKIILGGDYNTGSGYGFALVRYNSNGDLDSLFGNNGVATCIVGPGPSTDNVGNAIALQSNGKIILAGVAYISGNYDFALLRFNTNGVIDSTFGTNGITTTAIGSGSDNCYSMTVQANDKIVLGGDIQDGTAYKFTLARYTVNGSLDNSFGTVGIRIDSLGVNDDDYGYSVLMQPDQKIILGGAARTANSYDFSLLRYDSTGVLDNTFGTGGIAVADFNPVSGGTSDYGRALALQSDGKILLAGRTFLNGSEYGLMRFNIDGSIDTTFGNSGRVVYKVGVVQHNCYGLTVDINNKIIIGGQATSVAPDNFVLVRFTSGLTVGIDENNQEDYSNTVINVYPNPAENMFKVQSSMLNVESSLCVFNSIGELIFSSKVPTMEYTVDTKTWNAGIYFVQLKTNNSLLTKKIIIAKN